MLNRRKSHSGCLKITEWCKRKRILMYAGWTKRSIKHSEVRLWMPGPKACACSVTNPGQDVLKYSTVIYSVCSDGDLAQRVLGWIEMLPRLFVPWSWMWTRHDASSHHWKHSTLWPATGNSIDRIPDPHSSRFFHEHGYNEILPFSTPWLDDHTCRFIHDTITKPSSCIFACTGYWCIFFLILKCMNQTNW